MRRRMMYGGAKEQEYTLTTNQGNPDVYVDDVWVGKCVNGRLTWSAIVYNKAVSVKLENVSNIPSSTSTVAARITEVIDQEADISYPVPYIDTSKKIEVGYKRSLGLMAVREITTKSYWKTTTGQLRVGSQSISINYSEDKSVETVPTFIIGYENPVYRQQGTWNVTISGNVFNIEFVKEGYYPSRLCALDEIDVKFIDGVTLRVKEKGMFYLYSS